MRGLIRGKAVRTTIAEQDADFPLDHARRQFQDERPNWLWASGFTYVSTGQGFVYVACVIGAFARRIVG